MRLIRLGLCATALLTLATTAWAQIPEDQVEEDLAAANGNPLREIMRLSLLTFERVVQGSAQVEEVGVGVAEIGEKVDELVDGRPSVSSRCVQGESAEVTVCHGEECQRVVYPCHPYGCDGATGTCRSACLFESQCAAGSACDQQGHCVVMGNRCHDLFSVRQPNGNIEDCGGFRCVAGACQQYCTSPQDCKQDEDYLCVANLCVRQQISCPQGGCCALTDPDCINRYCPVLTEECVGRVVFGI